MRAPKQFGAYLVRVLDWPREALILPEERVYETAPSGLAVPVDLLTHPFLLLRADDEAEKMVKGLFDRYPVSSIVAVGERRHHRWQREGEVESDSDILTPLTTLTDAQRLQVLKERTPPTVACRDQDLIAHRLRTAHDALCRLPISSHEALCVLGRMVVGLITANADAQRWYRPSELLCSSWKQSFALLPPLAYDVDARTLSDEHLLLHVAYVLAPLDLRAIAHDLLGPLLTPAITRAQRRRVGLFLTPPELVDLVLDRSGVLNASSGEILDPAAGTGAFLVRAIAQARAQGGREAGASLMARAAAVEPNPAACAVLRLNLAIQWAITRLPTKESQPPFLIAEGDALLAYSEFPPEERSVCETHLARIAASAGFAYVIGNPPYIGESGNRAVFTKYRLHRFWKQFSEGKMDFLQYFIILGLSKMQLCENGRLCFVTSAYWLTADGAQRLRDLILSLAVVREVIFLSGRGYFPDAPGHDSVVMLLERCTDSVSRGSSRARVIRVDAEYAGVRRLADRVSAAELASNKKSDGVQIETFDLPQAAWRGRPWFLSGSTGDLAVLSILETYPRLGEAFVARQGVAPGTQRIGRAELTFLGAEWVTKHAIKQGEGVFVLTDDELAQLQLPATQRRYVRPFIKNSSIRRYAVDGTGRLWLLYLRHDEVRECDCPDLVKHLSRFRPLLTRKREYRLGRRDWFHLHWPRDEQVFNGEKIMTAQRGLTPAFAWVDQPLYAATDVYFIINSDEEPDRELISLKALTGILNSSLGCFWFAHRAKPKGEQREFFSKALESFPLPRQPCSDVKLWEDGLRELERCVDRLRVLPADQLRDLEGMVDQLVFDLYRLDATSQQHLLAWRCATGTPS
jgi:hypothetical protein